MKYKRIILLAAAALFIAASCSAPAPSAPGNVKDAASAGPDVSADRDGNPISPPKNIASVISLGPSNTELLIALGCGEKIIAADGYSLGIEGLKPGIPLFDMMAPDGELMIALEPDVLLVTGMTMVGGDDPFISVKEAGVCVIYIPSSTSIAEILEDIRFVAAVFDAKARGDAIIGDMEREIGAVRAVGAGITQKKSVYFELSAAPWMYSFGEGVFLHEMIELIGAENIFGDQQGWISVADEAVLDADPDVILTSTDYIDDPIGEIKERPGWDVLTAVRNGDVYYIDADASNRPNHNIITALKAMASAVYPDLY